MGFAEFWKLRCEYYQDTYKDLDEPTMALIKQAALDAWCDGRLELLINLPEPDIEYPEND